MQPGEYDLRSLLYRIGLLKNYVIYSTKTMGGSAGRKFGYG